MPKLNFCIQCISSHNYYVPTVSSFCQHLRKRRQTIWRGFLHAEVKSICTVYNWSAHSPAPSFANTTKISMSLALAAFTVNPSCNLQFLRLVVLLGRFQDRHSFLLPLAPDLEQVNYSPLDRARRRFSSKRWKAAFHSWAQSLLSKPGFSGLIAHRRLCKYWIRRAPKMAAHSLRLRLSAAFRVGLFGLVSTVSSWFSLCFNNARSLLVLNRSSS